MSGVKSCNSYDCVYSAKTGGGCRGDIEIIDGVCVTYFKSKGVDLQINPVHRNKGGAFVNNKGVFK